MSRLIDFVNAPDADFAGNPTAGRDAVLVHSLDQAVADLTQKFGPDMAKWTLGSYHYATIMHPMGAALTPELAAKFNVGNLSRGGDAYTVTATGGPGNQTGGGSFKNIMDTENWDNSGAWTIWANPAIPMIRTIAIFMNIGRGENISRSSSPAQKSKASPSTIST